MLPATLQVRRSTDVTFATIAEFFPDPLVPFQSMPRAVGRDATLGKELLRIVRGEKGEERRPARKAQAQAQGHSAGGGSTPTEPRPKQGAAVESGRAGEEQGEVIPKGGKVGDVD